MGSWVSRCLAAVAMCWCVTMLAPQLGRAAATASSGWQVDATHAGYLYGAGVVPPLTQAWSDDLGWSSPTMAISAGDVFVPAAGAPDPDGFPTLDLDAIGLATGAIGWSRQIAEVDSVPAFVNTDDGHVFTAVGDSGGDSAAVAVSAYDQVSGALQWTVTLPGDAWVPTPPITHDGVLYVDAEGRGGTVYALNETDGSLLWVNGPLKIGNSLVLAGGTLVIAGSCGHSYGLDPQTGGIVWADDFNCDGGGTLMSSFDGTRVWGEDAEGGEGAASGFVYAPATGDVLGRFTGYAPAFGYGEGVQQTLESVNGPATLQAIDPDTQAVRWSFVEPSGSQAALGTTPLLADGSVFAEGSQGQVWALSPCTGAITWQGQVDAIPQTILDSPVPGLAAGDGYLVVPTADGLAAFKGSGSPVAPAPDCAGGAGSPAATTPTVPTAPPTTSTPPATAPTSPATTLSQSAAPQSAPASRGASPAVTAEANARLIVRVMHSSCRAPSPRSGATCSLALAVSRPAAVTAAVMAGRRIVARGHALARSGRAVVVLRLARGLRAGDRRVVLSLRDATGRVTRRTVSARF